MQRPTTRWLYAAFASLLLLAALPLWSQDLNGYEYWFDQDFDSRVPIYQNLGPIGSLIETIPVAGLSDGFHTLNLRFRRIGVDTLPIWSSVSTYRFFKKEIDPANAEGFEYWYDGDRSGLVKRPLSGTGNQLVIAETNDISGLTDGFHSISLRVRSGAAWSSVSTYRFFKKTIDTTDVHGYEYWFDGNRDNLVGESLPISTNLLVINDMVDIGTLTDGFHTISLRVRSGIGWSSVSTYRFYKNSNLPQGGISLWEYWWDDNFANRDSMQVHPPAQDIFFLNEPLNMDSLCKGKHTFSLRFYGTNGWSSALKYGFEKTVPHPDEEVADFDIIADGGLVSFVNNSKNSTGYQWFFGDGDSDTLTNPFHTYNIGSYNVMLVAKGICQNDTLQKALVVPGVSSYTPKKGGKNAVVTMSLTGVGFVDGMDVRLKKAGQADIEAEEFVQNFGQMTAKFNFYDALPGLWDLVVDYPGPTVVEFLKGFTIEDSTYAKLSVKITSNWRMRSNFKNPMTVTVVNEGNADAAMVPLLVSGFPKGTGFQVLNERLGIETLELFDTLGISIDSIPLTFFDSIAEYEMLPLFLPYVPAGQSYVVQLQIQPPSVANTSSYDIVAELGVPLFDELTDFPADEADFGKCFEQLALLAWQKLFPANSLGQCFTGLAEIGYKGAKLWNKLAREENAHVKQYIEYGAPFLYSFGKKILKCENAINHFYPIGTAVKFLSTVADIYMNGRKYYAIADACIPVLKQIGQDFSSILIGNSFDPNIKTGPGGGSAGHYYATDSGPLVYVIQCENDTTALFAAQTVIIRDTLDTTKLDISTFRFTHVNVAGYGITLNIAGTQFIRDIYLPGVIARVTGHLDTTAGVVTWIMHTLDYSTVQVTTDPEAGILQPNFDPPEGDASVGFAIHKLPGLPDDVLIENRAVIIFDTNDPIVTNTWGVVSDNVPPVSQIGPLPAMQDSLSVHLTWTGFDNLSGVQFYRIYVSDNGSPYYQWRSHETGMSTVFTAQPGHSYRFYSIAVDSAGNVEALPFGFDAEIGIGGVDATKEASNRGYVLWQNVPNPFNGQTRIDYTLPEFCPQITLRVMDVSGRTVRTFSFKNKPPGTYSVLVEAGELLPGLYFYQLLAPGVRLTMRMVVE